MALTFLVGGARSGKSSLAVEVVTRRAAAWRDLAAPVVVVVTGEAHDEEMVDRIARHRAERPSAWRVVEAPRRLGEALDDIGDGAVVLVDCLSFWVANLLMDDVPDATIEAEARHTAAWARVRQTPVIAVSNEVGSGLVPEHPLGRRYRDVLGRVNATWATAAEDAWLVVAGRVLALAPSTAVFGARS
jgi:adenosylcobinamide kinase / adenosylcobinamide-phosphate guanylyltransferase